MADQNQSCARRVMGNVRGNAGGETLVQTTGVKASADRANIWADGKVLSFVTVKVKDEGGTYRANG